MKKENNPTQDLSQFMLAVFSYWRDKGFSVESSKRKMFSSIYSALDDVKSVNDIPMLYHESSLFYHHLIANYGKLIAGKYQDDKDVSEQDFEVLSELHSMKKNLESVIARIEGGISNGNSK